MLIDRMNYLQGKFPCKENAIVITNLQESLMWLEKRTSDRKKRNVEGTNKSVVMDNQFLEDYEHANGFTFEESEKELMAKQDYCCDTCGLDFRDHNEDFSVIEDENVMICRNCYEDNYQFRCLVCEEWEDNPTLENHHIYINPNLANESNLKTGIYKITEYPFYVGATGFGFQYFLDNSLKLLNEIDLNKAHESLKRHWSYKYDFPSGNICECCTEEWTKLPKLYNRIGSLNEIFIHPDGLHGVINKKAIIKNQKLNKQ